MSTILVTGGSGFIGGHAILQLLAQGHRVRTTVRSLKREADARALLQANGADAGSRLTFFAAELERDPGWAQAAAGSDYVLHVASPFPSGSSADEQDLIGPARDGALRVLRAARAAGVKRVVLTSSFAAIGYGHEPQTAPFDETSWTDVNDTSLAPYVRSKTLAELAAWDFIDKEGGPLELSVVNPVGVFGPLLGPHLSTSIILLQRLLDGTFPGCPQLYFGVVDVRDVVDLHILAMTSVQARGERFLAVPGDCLSMLDVAQILKRHLGASARKVPGWQLPNWLMHIAAMRDPRVRRILPELGKVRNATSDKARRLLGWAPRTSEEAIVATAESLVRLGLIKDNAKRTLERVAAA